MRQICIIVVKELIDSLRDFRALFTVGLVTLLAGPIALLMIANLLSSFEAKNERRVVVVANLAASPSLHHYLLRESAEIQVAPADYIKALQSGALQDPVIVVPPQFDSDWQQGKAVTLSLYTNSNQAKLQAGVSRIRRWLQGYAATQSEWYQLQQSLPPRMQDFLTIEELDQGNDKAQAVKIFGMLPYFLIFAALYGVWGAAIESTIGEREKGTLEALTLAVQQPTSLIIGKWLAVFLLGALLASLAIVMFIPAQVLIASDNLKAMFNFDASMAVYCVGLILPLVAVFTSLLLLLGAKASSSRQAQANATLVMLFVAFSPMLIANAGDQIATWQRCLPVLAQHHAMLDGLNGRFMTLVEWAALFGVHSLFTVILLLLTRKYMHK